MRVGVDTGGTFTDAVADDGRIAKVPSTPHDPGAAVRSAVETFATPSSVLAHGTTVATNALLERKGSTVALVTDRGFADVIEIARQDRPSLYDPFADRPAPLVARHHRYEVDGSDPDAIGALADALAPEIDAVAVCLLHSDLDPSAERAVAGALMARGHDVTCSTDVSPEFREYERTLTAVVNAYLRRPCRDYLARLRGIADDVFVLTSAGGLVPVGDGAERPASLLLSGPAGGVLAGAAAAAANGFDDAITFDMGGTSTDVCLVQRALAEAAPGRLVAGFPVRVPSLDVHTIGAGGGSIARIDAGGALTVGPDSAGADPGPACYGHGGREPTVTDADLVLGRIPRDHPFPGLGTLDHAAAARALERAGVAADGVIRVVNAAMEQAVRAVTVLRGVDPRACALVAFGGAGPLHACELAGALGMSTVIVPARAGVLSAVGLLGAPRQRDLVRSWPTPGVTDNIDDALQALASEAAALVGAGASTSVALDVRYEGQSHELTVPDIASFHDEHVRRNGYARPDAPVEVIALRATARVTSPTDTASLPVAARHPAVGPAVVAEEDCTIWVPDGWRARPGAAGALVIER